ncbi:hypothetical protein [Bacillus sp. HMF5848]|uniref:hypothetical protein n=1 Tax=Bacillus sp. HMF5848 TaxID=2495421 RepID=UPI00163A8B0E|nr:hypothetical protein [Bacillus sp. HMF5848]
MLTFTIYLIGIIVTIYTAGYGYVVFKTQKNKFAGTFIFGLALITLICPYVILQLYR